MNEKEALTRVKTGNFNGGYGFDMQLLVDAVGMVGEMFKSGQISEIVRCKACGDCRQDGYCERWHISVKPDFFCADGDDGNLQEGT